MLVTFTTSTSSANDVGANSSIGDLVWEDLNANGLQEPGEPGIPGVTVNLYNCSGNFLESTITDASGNYNFIVEPGNYVVEFEVPANYYLVYADQGADDTIDSDAASLGQTFCTTLGDQELDDTLDAGMYQYASIGDQVWEDFDGDGVRDENETGIHGVTVELYDCFGNLLATEVTDSNGSYQFTYVTPGDHYLGFLLPAGYLFSPQDQGTDDSMDNDADFITGQTVCTTLESQEEDNAWDAGMYQPASFGDLVWNDVNYNGLQDLGESGFPGVTVEFYDCFGSMIATTVTDANGFYMFTGLAPGEYYVDFVLPSGYFFSPQDQGTDESMDSDADIISGQTICIMLGSGEDNLAMDAGITSIQWSSIGDKVWNDLDIDGIQDTNESGIPGVTVELHDSYGNLLATTVTDANGIYYFVGLMSDDYSVRFVLPDGYVFSPQDQGADDSLDSDAITSTGLTAPATIGPGETNASLDAGIFEAIPLIDVEKFTNGLDQNEDPLTGVAIGDKIVWKYVITNTGNVPLDNVVLTDSREGIIPCPKNTLAPSESMDCAVEGIAEYGHYTNIATVTGQFKDVIVSDEDLGEYYGYEPGTGDWEPPAVPTANPLITTFVLGIFMILMLGKEKR